MKNIINKLGFETVFGGLFGVVAIAAIVAEMVIAGFDSSAIAGGVKDIASTIVIVMVFIVAVKNFVKNQPKKLADKLSGSLDDWGNNNCPLIFKTTDFAPVPPYVQGFTILSEPKEFLDIPQVKYDLENELVQKYASQKSKKTGKFIDMPSCHDMVSDKFTVKINFIQSHFINRENGFKDVADSINKRFAINGIQAQIPTEKAKDFTVSIPKISSADEIDQFIDLLDFVLTLVKIIA